MPERRWKAVGDRETELCVREEEEDKDSSHKEGVRASAAPAADAEIIIATFSDGVSEATTETEGP